MHPVAVFFRLFDANDYWSTPYMIDIAKKTSVTIDLQNMKKDDGTLCDPSHIYIAGFWSTGGSAIYIDKLILSDDGVNPSAILSMEENGDVVLREYFTLDGRRTSPNAPGISIVRKTYSNGTVASEKVLTK